jgi:hypothetical protein
MPAPLYHSGPLRFAMTMQHVGATLIVMERFDATAALSLIAKHRGGRAPGPDDARETPEAAGTGDGRQPVESGTNHPWSGPVRARDQTRDDRLGRAYP